MATIEIKDLQDKILPFVKDVSGKVVADAVAEMMAKNANGNADLAKAIVDASRQQSTTTQPREKGLGMARVVRARACAKAEGLPAVEGTAKILEQWGDKDLAAEVKALAASSAQSGGFLVPIQQSGDVIELRYNQTAVRGSGVPTLPLPSGTLTIPKVASGATGSYIGENQNITKSEQVFGQIQLTAHKLAVVTPISNDLIRTSSPQADVVVRNDIVRSLAVTEDAAFIRGDGTNGSVRGLSYFAPAANQLASAGAWATLANIQSDLGNMITVLLNNNVPMGGWRWLLAPRQWQKVFMATATTGNFVFQPEMSASKTLLGVPYTVTNQVPITVGTGAQSELYLFNPADMVIGDNLSLQIDIQDGAAYFDGSQVVSGFSRDQSVIKAVAEHDFGARYNSAIAFMTGLS